MTQDGDQLPASCSNLQASVSPRTSQGTDTSCLRTVLWVPSLPAASVLGFGGDGSRDGFGRVSKSLPRKAFCKAFFCKHPCRVRSVAMKETAPGLLEEALADAVHAEQQHHLQKQPSHLFQLVIPEQSGCACTTSRVYVVSLRSVT